MHIIFLHRSPCLRFKNIAGNSWRHAAPKRAVSSSALYREALHFLQENYYIPRKKGFILLLMTVVKQAALTLAEKAPPVELATASSTFTWLQKKRSPSRALLWLIPAAFFLGRPNSASME